MADLLHIIRDAGADTTGYSVFERDQVLSETQLNSVARHLDEQGRLTRLELLGTGIVAGLDVGLAGGRVRIRRGLGISGDGDLLLLPRDAEFDGIRPYDPAAPAYPPFHVEGQRLPIFELAAADTPRAQPLSSLPEGPAAWSVVLLMESRLYDPDLCSGTDCDNLGQDLLHTRRLLLLRREDAARLAATPASARQAAALLPEVVAERPALGAGLTSPAALAGLYRQACGNTAAALGAALARLGDALPGPLGELFGGDPSPGWNARLAALGAEFASRDQGLQYFHDFLKDLADTWNELRHCLDEDDSVLLPDPGAKHLLLGELVGPARTRSGFHPSPLLGGRESRARAAFLLRRLDAQMHNFSLPDSAGAPVRITPSRTESSPLEARAIPYYYAVGGERPMHLAWNPRLSRRGEAGRNPGYHAAAYQDGSPAPAPFSGQIGGYDFFRVEGHLGQDAQAVLKTLEALARAHNLPIALRAVLLHADRGRVRIKPPIRYGALHSLHSLLRKEVATQLEEGRAFNQAFRDGLEAAASRQEIPAQLHGQALAQATRDNFERVRTALDKAAAPLGASRYTAYRHSLGDGGAWKSDYRGALDAAGNFKLAFGDRVRTEFTTPFDTLLATNHGAWLEWLDELIDARDAREDERLLLASFLKEHPGLEHRAGVVPGGTFVLVYDDAGRVVADFCLPYHAPETAAEEPEEPPPARPPFKPPLAIDKGFRPVMPLDDQFASRLSAFKAEIRPEWQGALAVQADYLNLVKDSLNVFGTVITGKADLRAGALDQRIRDPLLQFAVDDVTHQTDQATRLRETLLRQDLSADDRAQAEQRLQDTEAALARAIADTGQYMATHEVDVGGQGDGAQALAALARGADLVRGEEATTSLREGLRQAETQAAGPRRDALSSLIRMRGL